MYQKEAKTFEAGKLVHQKREQTEPRECEKGGEGRASCSEEQ